MRFGRMENSYPRKINIRFPVFLFLSFRFDKKRHCLVIKKKKKRELESSETLHLENENELNRIKK